MTAPTPELVAFDLPCAVVGCNNEITIRSTQPHAYLRRWFAGDATVYCSAHATHRTTTSEP